MKKHLLSAILMMSFSSVIAQTVENPQLETVATAHNTEEYQEQRTNEADKINFSNPTTFNTAPEEGLGIQLRNAAPEEIKPDGSIRRYKLNWKADAPITAVGMAWSFFAFSKIYDKDTSTVAEMNALDKKNVPGIDRWAAGMHNKKVDDFSNNLFYGSLLFPAFLFIDKDIRKDAAKISFLYLETFAITGLLYTGSAFFIDRYRPESYKNDIPQSQKTSGNYRNAFFAGHPALVATASFFAAKVYADYHPHQKGKYYVYGGAALATGAMIYMRHIAGKHFPTDLLVGTIIGVGVPHVVLHFHKKAANKDRAWNLSPSVDPFYGGGYGLTFNYRFK